MHGSLAEIVGFFSRWCLLALAAAGSIVTAWTAASAASAAAVGRPKMVLSDAIWRPPSAKPPHEANRRQPTAYVIGYPLQTGQPLARALFVSTLPDAKPRLVYADRGRAIAGFPLPSEGLIDIQLRGILYGQFAFERLHALVKVVASDQTVFAVDARLASTSPGEQRGPLADCLREMRRIGEVVLFHGGRIEHYERLRASLRARYPGTLQVFATDRNGHILASLRHIAWTLHRREGNEPLVVTTDRTLANAAAAETYPTYWIGADSAEESNLENLVRYRDLDEFKAKLASQSQSTTPGRAE